MSGTRVLPGVRSPAAGPAQPIAARLVLPSEALAAALPGPLLILNERSAP
jgi:hypothetical protein